MQKLSTYINEVALAYEMEEIDNHIICESLQCKLLKDIAKQLLTDTDQKGRTYSWETSDNGKNKTFKDVFADRYNAGYVNWSDVTDEDITRYTADDWEEGSKTSRKITKSIKDVISEKDADSVIVVQDPTTEMFLYVIYRWGNIVALTGDKVYGKNTGERINIRNGHSKWIRWKDLPQRDKIKLCQNKNIYIIDVKRTVQANSDLKNQRYASQKGMLTNDPEELKMIAKQNYERYKEILTKRKANREKNDELLDEANEIIKKVSDIANAVAKDPIKYADIISDLSILTSWVYDDTRTSYSPNQRQYVSYGKAGLLPNLMKYIKGLNNANKSGSSYQLADVKNAKVLLQGAIDKCKEYLAKINIS